MFRTLGGYALGATALIACPCHLPLTAPLLLALLGGTSLGVFLRDNPQALFLGMVAYFVVALAGAFWFLGRRAAAGTSGAAADSATAGGASCCPPAPPALAGHPTGPREVATRG